LAGQLISNTIWTIVRTDKQTDFCRRWGIIIWNRRHAESVANIFPAAI
jgi:hypothetical protein